MDLELVQRIRGVVTEHAVRTPVIRSAWLSGLTGSTVWLKCENLQETGSFKFRGALAAVSMLDEEERRDGVLSSSAGNHGAGLARAARLFDVPCKIVVPVGTPEVKIARMRTEGAEVVTSPHDGYDATQAWTLENERRLGGIFISPFEHPGVMAGNGGTTALEIFEDLPDVDVLVVPCGGGGCINGMGLVSRARPDPVRLLGVNTEASPGMWLSRRDGFAHLELDSAPTIAEGLEGGVGEITYRMGLENIDDMLVVPEATIRRAVAGVAAHDHLIVEGSGAAAVAAVMEGLVKGERICVLLTGGNIDMSLFRKLLEEYDYSATPDPKNLGGSSRV